MQNLVAIPKSIKSHTGVNQLRFAAAVYRLSAIENKDVQEIFMH